MSEQRENEPTFAVRCVQLAVMVAIVALQDPELRRNIAWGLAWAGERIRSFVMPDDDEPPAPEVSRMLQEARDITMRGAE